MTYMSTHHLGVMCAVCEEVLELDDCCPAPHGYGLQKPGEWAKKTWPGHACFKEER